MPAKPSAATEPQWTEIQPFTPPLNMEPGEEITGYYRGANEVEVPDPNSEQEDGKRSNLLHEFSDTPEGETFGLWGSAGLDKRLADIRVGALCRVRYEGKVDLSGGRTARQYRVWTDSNQPF